ncbi:MAG TPA: hypothetical protein VN281_12025 [Verrucomicrobiae bacterium]|nr:hypothetical protein [Verrucomicrobiae bacterium]
MNEPPNTHGSPPVMDSTYAAVQQQIADNEHLKLLAIFHYIAGGLAAFFSCIPFIHLAIGLALMFAPQQFGSPNNRPPQFLGMFFVLIASFIILLGWTQAILMFLCGRFISRRAHHTFCFVVGCVECLFMPFGTILGVFTIIVLIRPSVKELFGIRELS